MTQKELSIYKTGLGSILKNKRQDSFISILSISKLSGLHRNTITKLEKGNGCIDSFLIYSYFLKMEIKIIFLQR